MANPTIVVPHVGNSHPQFRLAHFTHGKLATETGIKFGLLESSMEIGAHGTKKRKLVAETKGMQYVGSNYDRKETPHSTNLCRYLVGVFDKKKNKVKVYNSESFALNPYSPGDEEDEDEVDQSALTYAEKVDQLTSAFGSSKRKKAMESRRKNKIKGDVLEKAVGSAVDHALSLPETSAATALLASPVAAAASVIPPHDLDATTPEEAYKLEDIISGVEMNALQNPAQVFVDCTPSTLDEWKVQETYPLYVIQAVQVLPVGGEARMRKACLLMYMSYLIKLYLLKVADLRRKSPLPEDIPSVITNTLYEKYTLLIQGTGKKPTRCMSAKLKDKLVCYILVLGLIIEEFNMDFGLLQKDLKMGQQKIMIHLRALGCKVSNKKVALNPLGPKVEVKSATLPMPLTFPDLNQPKKIKGR